MTEKKTTLAPSEMKNVKYRLSLDFYTKMEFETLAELSNALVGILNGYIADNYAAKQGEASFTVYKLFDALVEPEEAEDTKDIF